MTGIFFASTVTEHVAVFPPSAVVTVTVAFPGLRAVTLPPSTEATSDGDDDQLTVWFVALEGDTVAEIVSLSPSTSVIEVLLRLTPDTAIVVGFGSGSGVGFGVGVGSTSGPPQPAIKRHAAKDANTRLVISKVFIYN